MKKQLLLTPGPSIVPEPICAVLGQSMIHHRTSEFRSILKEVHEGLQKILFTKNPVILLSCSGTGAMQAAVTNFLSWEDKVIVINGGKFGERWKEICQAYKVNVIEYKVDWGNAPDPNQLVSLLEKNPEVKAVYTTLCETSTATHYDIENLAKCCKGKEVLFIVDAISGLGQDPLLTDQWGVDIVVSGSQKGLMLPPGLAWISVSEKAKQAMQKANLPNYYFDLKKAIKSYQKDDTPFTPAVSLIRGLALSLKIIQEEGIENRWKNFAKMAEATRQALTALGLNLYSKRPSSSVTAVYTPEEIPSSQLVKKLRSEYGVSIAGGQAEAKDKIIRIAHMGAVTSADLISGLSYLEKCLADLGYNFTPGQSLNRFQQVYYFK